MAVVHVYPVCCVSLLIPTNTNVALAGSEVVLLGTNSTFANIGNPNSNDLPAESCKTGGVYTGAPMFRTVLPLTAHRTQLAPLSLEQMDRYL